MTVATAWEYELARGEEGGRDGGREGGREGGRKGGRKGGREKEGACSDQNT